MLVEGVMGAAAVGVLAEVEEEEDDDDDDEEGVVEVGRGDKRMLERPSSEDVFTNLGGIEGMEEAVDEEGVEDAEAEEVEVEVKVEVETEEEADEEVKVPELRLTSREVGVAEDVTGRATGGAEDVVVVLVLAEEGVVVAVDVVEVAGEARFVMEVEGVKVGGVEVGSASPSNNVSASNAETALSSKSFSNL